MKTRYILLSLLAVPAVLLAMPLMVGKPSMTLPSAYYHAISAFGADTNQVYCVGANRYSSGDSWTFTFCTTNEPSKVKWVVVDSDGKTHFEEPKAIR